MTEQNDALTPPRDPGAPDPVERDGAALSSAEDLDEDRLRVDPLESGMDPPERWSGVDSHGMTPREQAEDRPLSDRLGEEEPDVQPEPDAAEGARPDRHADLDERIEDERIEREAAGRGQTADEAGGSMASAQRTPSPSE